jgi:hypothetical protein
VHNAGGGEKGEAGDEDGVAGPNPEGSERQEQGVGAARKADGMLDAAVGGGFVLKLLHVRAKDELAGIENRMDRCVDLGTNRVVLAAKVEDGSVHTVSGL